MKYLVQVMPRPESLDPQGRAVQTTLAHLGFNVTDCRVGKAIIVELPEDKSVKALDVINQMAQKLLVNPLIETYEVKAL